jgi:hypothetical protein
VVVAGINIRTRHIKKNYQEAGKILKYEAALSASNVMILDPKTNKPSRIGYKVDDKGKKIRISKISGEEVKVVKPKVEKKAEKKATKATEGTKATKVSEKKEEATPGKKSPFWKRMGFSAGAPDGDASEARATKPDHTIPDQQLHRSGGRGS